MSIGFFKYLRRSDISQVIVGHFIAQSSDYYGKDVTFLLSADDIGAGWQDTSNSNTTIISNGVTQRGTGPYTTDLGPASSIGAAVFNGYGYLDVSNNASTMLSVGDFTIDFWISSANASGTRNLAWLNGNSASAGYCALNVVIIDGQLGVQCSYEGTAWDISSLSLAALATNGWSYISMQRTNGVLSIYKDGTKLTDIALPRDLMLGNYSFIGAGPSSARNNLVGSITDFRLTRGIARYSGATAAVPAIPSGVVFSGSSDPYANNVSLMLNFNDVYGTNIFVDEVGNTAVPMIGTGNANTLLAGSTVLGYPVLTANNAKFDGSSGLFSGNYLMFPQCPAYGFTGDFTFETFVMFNTLNTTSLNHPILTVGSPTTGLCIKANATTLSVYINNVEKAGTLPGAFTFQTSTWYHLAVVRLGAQLDVYINGHRMIRNTAASGTISTNNIYIGYSNTTEYAQIMLDNLRLTQGVARYTANFTTPIAPLGVVANTAALLSGSAFTDTSGNTIPVSVAGTIQASPFSDNGWCSYFNGTTDYQQLPSATTFAYGASNFTIEMWIYPDNPTLWTTGNTYLIDHGSNVGYINYTANKINWYGNAAHTSTATGLIPANAWTHVAVVRNAGVIKIFVNGVSATLSATADSWNLTTATSPRIGAYGGSITNNFSGMISNLRVTKSAVYTSNFTPSTSALSAITNTILMYCQNQSIVDNATTPSVITYTGGVAPTLSATTPFSGVGASYQFNGTTQRLVLSQVSQTQIGTNDFSIECWVQPGAVGVAKGIVGNLYSSAQTQNGWALITNTANKFVFQTWSTVFLTSVTAFASGSWYHVVVQRRGSFLSMFVNGVMEANSYMTNNLNYFNNIHVGWSNVNGFFTGYISNVRLCNNGTAYNTDITLPTGQLPIVPTQTGTNDPYLCNVTLLSNGESITQDSLGVTKFTNSGGVSAVTLSNTVYKFGGASMAFSGGTLTSTGSVGYQLGQADFTLEGWIYVTGSGDKQVVLDLRSDASQNNSVFALYGGGGTDGINAGGFSWLSNGIKVTSNAPVERRQWYHFAVTKDYGTLRIFVNGAIRYSGGDCTFHDQGTTKITLGADVAGNSPFVGYIGGLRLTKGYCRYRNNFLPSGNAFDTGTYVTDPYSAQVSYYLTGDGTFGGQNFTDASPNALVPTFNTPAVLTSTNTSPFTPATASWSVGMNGAVASNCMIAGDNILNFGANNWTVEGWVNMTSLPVGDVWLGHHDQLRPLVGKGTAGGYDGFCALIGSTKLSVQNNDIQYSSAVAHGMAINTWYHLAFVRNGNTVYFYVNGVAKGSVAFNVTVTTGPNTWIGSSTGNNGWMNGMLSNIRVVKGTAVYTAAFTPSTTPLTAISGTSLLCFQSKGFTDNSANNWPIVTYGAMHFTAAACMNRQTTLYSPNAIPAYLTYPANTPAFNLGSGAFTMEGWFCYTSGGYNHTVIYKAPANVGGYELYCSSNANWYLLWPGNAVALNAYTNPGHWDHFALVRNNGTLMFFLNGKQTYIANQAYNWTNNTDIVQIGKDGATNYLSGYLSDFRITLGVARYTTEFALPVSKYASKNPSPDMVSSHYVGDPSSILNLISPVYGTPTASKIWYSFQSSLPANNKTFVYPYTMLGWPDQAQDGGGLNAFQRGGAWGFANRPYFIQEMTHYYLGGAALMGVNTAGIVGPTYTPETFTVTAALNDPSKAIIHYATFTPYSASGYTCYWSTSPGINVNDYKVNSVGVGQGTVITGLLPQTTYYFTLVNNNGAGDSAKYPEVTFTTGATATSVLAAPTNFSQANPDCYTWTFAWTPLAGATGYNIYMARSSKSGGVNSTNADATFTVSDGSAGTAIWAALDPTVELTLTHYFSIDTINPVGISTVPCAQVSRAQVAKGTGPGISCTQKGPVQVKLYWAQQAATVTGYRVYWSRVSGFDGTNYQGYWDISGLTNVNTIAQLSGMGDTVYYRLAPWYNNDAGQEMLLGPQLAVSAVADTFLLNSVTADATLLKFTANVTAGWNTVDESWNIDVYSDAALTIYNGTVPVPNTIVGTVNLTFDTSSIGWTIGLVAGQAYWCRPNVWHTSSNSSTYTGTTRMMTLNGLAPPGSLSAPLVQANSIRFNWANPNLANVTKVQWRVCGWSTSALATACAAPDMYDNSTFIVQDYFGNMPRGNPMIGDLTTAWFQGMYGSNQTIYFRAACRRQDSYGNIYGDPWNTAAWSNTVAVTMKADVAAGAPTIISVVKGTPGTTTATITWTPVTGATQYNLCHSAQPQWTEDGTHWTTGPNMPFTTYASVGNTTTATVTNCLPGEINNFKLQAVVGGLTSEFGNVMGVLMDADVGMDVVTTAPAADLYNSYVINWPTWAGVQGGAIGYRILCQTAATGNIVERAFGSADIDWKYTPKAVVGQVNTVTLTGLLSNTLYNVVVQPYNTIGFGPCSAQVQFTTALMAAPTVTSFTMIAAGANGTVGSAKLVWGAVANATNYNVRINETGTWLATDGATGSTFPNTYYQWDNLVAGHTYYVQVQALTSSPSGWSAWSSPVSVTFASQFELFQGNATLDLINKKYGTGSVTMPGGGYGSTGMIVHPHESMNLGSSNWTVEGWYMFKNGSAINQELAARTGFGWTNPQWRIYTNVGGNIVFDSSSTGASKDIASAKLVGAIPAGGVWVHIAVVRSGNTFTTYLNGVVGSTWTSSTAYAAVPSGPLFVGTMPSGNYGLNGNVDDFRVTVGTARYTGAFTPPGELPELPVPDSYYRSVNLLLHCSGANNSTSIVDSSRLANTLTASGAMIAEFKNRITDRSLSIPSNSAYVSLPASSNFAFGVANFTVEAWVYVTSFASDFNVLGTNTATPDFKFVVSTAGALSVWNGTAMTAIGGSVPLNRWCHVTFMRYNTVVTATGLFDGLVYGFVNGQLTGSTAVTGNIASTQQIRIGATDVATTGTGYIDELRVTMSARYPNISFITIQGDWPDATSSTVDPYFNQVVCLIKGNTIGGVAQVIDNSNHNTIVASPIKLSLPSYNTRTTLRVTMPEYPKAQGYAIYYSKASDCTDPRPNINGVTGVGRTTCNTQISDLTSLSANTQYYVRVAPYCDGLESPCINQTPLTLTTAAIAAPTAPTLTVGTPATTAINVAWPMFEASGGPTGVTGYTIYYSTNSNVAPGGVGVSSLGVKYSSFAAAISALTTKTTYYMVMTVTTKWGESSPSSVVSWTTS